MDTILEGQLREQEVRFRCPHCDKLFMSDRNVFEGQSPEFDCVNCHKTFTLSKQINSYGIFQTLPSAVSNLLECPNCLKLKPATTDECPNCGVYVSKFIEIQKVESPSLYELNQLWKSVIEDFQNDEAHQLFINRCQERSALSFAFQKYETLKKTLGFDQLCEKYLVQIEIRLSQQLRKQYIEDSKVVKEKHRRSFLQITFSVLTLLGIILLVVNKINPIFPNFTGLIVALTILSFGLLMLSTQRTPLR